MSETIIVSCNFDADGTYTVTSHPDHLWGDPVECADLHEARDEAQGMVDSAAADGVSVNIKED